MGDEMKDGRIGLRFGPELVDDDNNPRCSTPLGGECAENGVDRLRLLIGDGEDGEP